MSTWRRALVRVRCGGCGEWIAQGDPLWIVQLPAVTARRYRCVACRGPAPADLPEPAMVTMVRRQGTFAQVVAALDREPGSEG